MYLSVLIAEDHPENHPSWNQAWMHHAVDELYTYNISAAERTRLRNIVDESGFAKKGIYDYIYALRRCHEIGTPYIGMFEDDILLADGWLVRTLVGLQRIFASEGALNSWLFMRLFNQERSIGWASRYIGGNNEHWIIAGIGICIWVVIFFARRWWTFARTHIDMGTVWVLILVLNPALVILFFQCGKASMLPPSAGVFDEPFGCCSQAMIFPREQVPSVIEFLQEKQQGQIDLLLNHLALETGLKRYALYPVQAQHIGKTQSNWYSS